MEGILDTDIACLDVYRRDSVCVENRDVCMRNMR